MAEYQKLQQKNGILKRAVVDEQQKRSSLELKIKVFLLRATTSAFPDNCRAHGVAGSRAAEPKEPGGNRHAQFQQHSTDQACRGADGAVFSLWMHAPRCACSFSCLDRTLGPNGWRLPFKARLSLWASRPHTIGGSGAAQEEGWAGVVWRLVRQTDRIDKGLSLTFLLVVSHRLD